MNRYGSEGPRWYKSRKAKLLRVNVGGAAKAWEAFEVAAEMDMDIVALQEVKLKLAEVISFEARALKYG